MKFAKTLNTSLPTLSLIGDINANVREKVLEKGEREGEVLDGNGSARGLTNIKHFSCQNLENCNLVCQSLNDFGFAKPVEPLQLAKVATDTTETTLELYRLQ